MEERKKEETVRTKKSSSSEVRQLMSAITNDTVRGIIRLANEIGIKKDNIVSLLRENGQYVLIYFN